MCLTCPLVFFNLESFSSLSYHCHNTDIIQEWDQWHVLLCHVPQSGLNYIQLVCFWPKRVLPKWCHWCHGPLRVSHTKAHDVHIRLLLITWSLGFTVFPPSKKEGHIEVCEARAWCSLVTPFLTTFVQNLLKVFNEKELASRCPCAEGSFGVIRSESLRCCCHPWEPGQGFPHG